MTEMRYQVIDEQTLYFDLPKAKNLRIKGILRGSLNKPLVVMVHGLADNGNELPQYLGARYLYEHGISSLRLFMYDFESNTRNLLQTSLQDHADDFDEVVKQLRARKVPRVFGVGHSYGGMTILLSKSKLDAAVLWDPTHGLVWHGDADKTDEDNYPEQAIGEYVIGLAGYGYVTSKQMEDFNRSIGDNTNWAVHKGYPLKVISAEKGIMTDLGKRYIDAADEPKEQVIIKNASHQFEDSDKVMLELFHETAIWFKDCLAQASPHKHQG